MRKPTARDVMLDALFACAFGAAMGILIALGI